MGRVHIKTTDNKVFRLRRRNDVGADGGGDYIGLVFATKLTLGFVPVLYSIMFRVK